MGRKMCFHAEIDWGISLVCVCVCLKPDTDWCFDDNFLWGWNNQWLKWGQSRRVLSAPQMHWHSVLRWWTNPPLAFKVHHSGQFKLFFSFSPPEPVNTGRPELTWMHYKVKSVTGLKLSKFVCGFLPIVDHEYVGPQPLWAGLMSRSIEVQ